MPARLEAPPLAVGVTRASRRWAALAAPERVCRRAARAAWSAAAKRAAAAEVCVLLANDRQARRLNARYRGIDRPTNVLAFPNETGGDPAAGRRLLGDIVVAYETLAREARVAGRRPDDHLSHLVVHGMLHLLGYDHVRDREAFRMERMEVRVLRGIGIADPYRDPPAANSKR